MKMEAWAKRIFLILGILATVSMWVDLKKFFPLSSDRLPAADSVIKQNFDLVTNGIYKTAVKLGQLPVKLAVPLVIRYKIGDYLDTLADPKKTATPLKAEIRDRIKRRINRGEFVDAVIPFVWALKEQYVIPKEFAAEHKFESYIVNEYSLREKVPGLRHSLFSWGIEEKKDASEGGDIPQLKMDDKIVVGLIELYDTMFLQNSEDYIFTSKTIQKETVDKAVPRLEKLLRSIAESMPVGSEHRGALEGIVGSRIRMEAIVISFSTFLRNLVQKNYYAFASMATRREDLKVWLETEFDKKDFGLLFDYLNHMNRGRRFGVHIAVDGLQGRLLQALAHPADDPFFARLIEDEKNLLKQVPSFHPSLTKAPETRNEFLYHVSNNKRPLLDRRYLPFFKKLYASRGSLSHIARQGIATTPTISVRNLPIIKTGADVAGPGGTGIPNFHFVDRPDDRAYYFFGNDALLLEDIARKQGLRTMFERMPSLNSLNCMAQYDAGSQRSFDPLINLIVGEKARDFGELLCYAELKKRAEVEKKLYQLRRVLMSNIASGRGFLWVTRAGRSEQIIKDLIELSDQAMPEYLLYYNPWPDHFAHFKGAFSNEILSPTGELNRLDYWLGKFSELYEKAGLSSKTLWAMAGDHGLTPVYYYLNPEVVVFDAMREEGTQLVVEKISSDEGEGPKITHPDRSKRPSMKEKDLVIASTAGGNYMIDAFVSQEPREWNRQPLHKELKVWRSLEGKELDLVEEIRQRLKETLDYLAVREVKPSKDMSVTRLVSTHAGKRVDALVYRAGKSYFVINQNDSDLLNLRSQSRYAMAGDPAQRARLIGLCLDSARFDDPKSWCSAEQWRDLTAFTDRPDSVVQIAHLFDEDRAGTINLFPRAGVGYNTKVPGRHAGEDFHEKDAFVGIWGEVLMRRKFSKGKTLPDSVVNGSTATTIYHYLTGREPTGTDGFGFPSLLKD